MSWFGIGKEIAKPIEAVGKLYTTDKERLEGETKLLDTLEKTDLGQQHLNEMMVGSTHFFLNSWPSLTGWTAGACITLYYVPQLILANYLWIKDCLTHNQVMPFPLDPTDINQLVYLMFGFGGHHLLSKKMK